MNYSIELSERAELDIIKLRESGDRQALKKLNTLINELRVHPETGTGKPERLKYVNKWSRRINKKHRLIYEILDQIVTVEIIQAYGHYDDK
ncbi:MAG: Txe/YoeB family addiction module toxin [Bacteroidales bacterium]|nr:Txe/YoeB family addiction module toxin [Bacteroidales bacterium]